MSTLIKDEGIRYFLDSVSRHLNTSIQLLDQEGNDVINLTNPLNSLYDAMSLEQKADLTRRFVCILQNITKDSYTQFYEIFPGLKIAITPLPVQDSLYLVSGFFLSTGDIELLRSSLEAELGNSLDGVLIEKYSVLDEGNRTAISSELDRLRQHLADYIRNIHLSSQLKIYYENLYTIHSIFSETVSFEQKFMKTAALLRESCPFSIMGLAIPLSQNKYRVEYVYGEHKERWKDYEFDVGEGFFGWVLMSRSASQWNDVTRDPRYYSIRSVCEQLKSLSIFPLLQAKDNIGLLFFSSEEINLFSEDWIPNVQRILSHFGHGLITMGYESKMQYMSNKISILMGISQLLTTNIDPKKILSIVGDFLMTIEGADQSFGAIVNDEKIEYLVGRGIMVEDIKYYCKQLLTRKAEEVVTEQQTIFPIHINDKIAGWFFVGSKDKINHKDVMFTNTMVSVACTVLKNHISFNNQASFDPTEILLSLIKFKNEEAYQHSLRVKHWAELICAHLNVDEETKSSAIKSALLHNIGLLVTDKDHFHIGAEVTAAIPALEQLAPIIHAQDEYYDGSGPIGLKGDEIPYGSKILHIANQFDTRMGGSDRDSDHMLKIILEMEQQAGKQFDPHIMDIFSHLIKRRFSVMVTNVQLNTKRTEPETVINTLSPRELEVILLMVKGLSNKQIAGSLHISEHTVKNHISNIFQKLNISDRTSVVSYAYKNGLING
jgi:response regulator RpfG family c-di-GMP phosphodiesterase/DNA-binding CsgD family transcriptional regulator